MGFRICYLASTASPQEMSDALGLTMGAPADERPEGEWWAARLLTSGWTILWSEDENFGRSAVRLVEALSQTHQTYVCEVNETCMWSSAEFWQDGRCEWKATHAGDGGDIFDLTETGDLPENYSSIAQRHIANQHSDGDGVDHIFEVPLDLADSVIGFRHDEYLEAGNVEMFFPVAPPAKKGFFARLLGK